MWINELGELSCDEGTHRAKIIMWRFDCGDHTYGGRHYKERYLIPDFQGFSYAMCMALPYMKEAEATWVKKLVTSIEEQFDPEEKPSWKRHGFNIMGPTGPR